MSPTNVVDVHISRPLLSKTHPSIATRASTSISSNLASPYKHLLRLLRPPSRKRRSARWLHGVGKAARPGTPRRRRGRFGFPSFQPGASSGADTGRLSSLTESLRHTGLAPSPLTPAVFADLHGIIAEDAEEVEEACQWFEWRLAEMVVEEGRVRDLGDVEELAGCWKELSSPVFVDLVCRFYLEVCMDLFYGGDGVALYDEEV